MTLQGALRFDRAWSYFLPQTLPASNYLPFTVSYPETQGVRGYKDLTPRFGVAYDVFGNAKTAVKFNMGKYLEASSNGVGFYSATNPINRLTTSSGIRTWNDVNSNFVPDCDLLNMSPNLECGQGSTSYGKRSVRERRGRGGPGRMGAAEVGHYGLGAAGSAPENVGGGVTRGVGFSTSS
jgi:hypothetical protein